MKNVLITGANKGIGFETAKQMAELGYFVYLGSRNKQRGLDAVRRLKDSGITNVDLIEIDVTNIDSVRKARQELETKTGVLDVLINNAGVAGEQPQSMSTGSIDNLRKVFETNFFGAVQTTQQFLDLLKKSDQPRIVNVSSGLGSLAAHSGDTANPNLGAYDAYSSSKVALNAFTVLLAAEFKGTEFRINSVGPGYTATDLNGNKGTQTVGEAASRIVRYATLGDDGPTAGFFKDEKIPW